MQSTKTTIRRLACTAGLALTALAAIASGAAGGPDAKPSKTLDCGPAQTCMTDAEYRALLIRSLALNRKYGLGTSE